MKTVTYSMQPSVIKMLEKLVAEDKKTGDSQSKSGKISDLIRLEFAKVFRGIEYKRIAAGDTIDGYKKEGD